MSRTGFLPARFSRMEDSAESAFRVPECGEDDGQGVSAGSVLSFKQNDARQYGWMLVYCARMMRRGG